MVRCPVCSSEFEAEPLKTWRFRFYQVKRYQCTLCGAKFNLYENRETSFTIPKARGVGG